MRRIQRIVLRATLTFALALTFALPFTEQIVNEVFKRRGRTGIVKRPFNDGVGSLLLPAT